MGIQAVLYSPSLKINAAASLPNSIRSSSSHMHHSRNYSYDDQPGHYTSEHIPRHQSQFPYSATPQYDRSYQQPQSSGQYYLQNTDISADPYYRPMTPGVQQPSMSRQSTSQVSTNYTYASGSGRPSSSSYDSSPYSSQDAYYQAQQSPYSREPRSHHSGMSPLSEAAFIPTPSEMYNNYPPQQITVPPHSPTPASYGIPQYPQHSPKIEQRPTRISIGRPQTSPTSGSSSGSGERFQCDQCPKTFSRSHDRKRHHETQHQERPTVHRCRWCHKEFSRADSLKRHLDNGCDEMPQ